MEKLFAAEGAVVPAPPHDVVHGVAPGELPQQVGVAGQEVLPHGGPGMKYHAAFCNRALEGTRIPEHEAACLFIKSFLLISGSQLTICMR